MQRIRRQQRLINIIALLAAVVSTVMAAIQFMTGWDYSIAILELGVAAICASIPLLHRFGKLVPHLC